MKLTSFLIVLLCLMTGCSDGPRQNTQNGYGPEELELKEKKLEELFVRIEKELETEKYEELKQLHVNYKKTQIDLEKAIPELADDPDYYQNQCKYTESIIALLEAALPKPTN